MKKLLLFFFVIVCWGCSSHKSRQLPKRVQKLKNLMVIPAGVNPIYTISFKKDAVYSSSKKVLLGNIHSISVDSLGHVYISNWRQSQIDVFASDGQYITHIGRHGRGRENWLILLNFFAFQTK
jgi:hypothetical protein